MVDPDVVARKIANASARLADVDRLLATLREEFLGDVERRDLTAFYIQLAIQECIDLAGHWLSESDWQPPDDAGSAFDVLADHGLISRDLPRTSQRNDGGRRLSPHPRRTSGAPPDRIGEVRQRLDRDRRAALIDVADGR